LEQQDPFILRLIVQCRLGRRATDDALDAQVAAAQELLEDFAGGRAWEIGEEVVNSRNRQVTAGGLISEGVRQ
jgi:hypothetical protein